jgi:hypothetical protein
MICPFEIASELSAFEAARVGDHGRHGVLHAGRSGASDEGGSDFAGDGEEDHVVAQAAEIKGISDRQMRRWRVVVKSSGSGVCLAAGGGKPSPKKVPLAVVEKVQGLCEP